MEEDAATSPRSSTRPAPTRGILKNPLRRPSYRGDGEVAQTDEERQEPEQGGGRARVNEQYVPVIYGVISIQEAEDQWTYLTEIQKDSLMSV
jgi:hypothetical protein